ncbi:universal stress protein [Halorubellus sp. JP-L1]|uniref:universal stress protein n=1 Tax=Halorubellus sp. JP-L1 TaxID=2715753 RepID=UPI00140CB83F|nr:universal stress protein [Halorubellus sp. JP-L1]NHN42396.1 universal stress protein [Halorubellus sp. JP-L1]
MFEEVVVATDGSDCGMRAARVGVELAATYDASATVVVAADGELSTADARSIADDVSEIGAANQLTVRTRVLEDDPRSAIVETAVDADADVIAMGRHGHAGLRERFLGSVTERVLRSTDRPVLTVPEQGQGVGDYEDVLVTSDGSDAARAAIPAGASVATTYDATMHVLSVVDVAREAGPFNAGGVSEEYVDGLVAEATEELDAFAAACEEAAGDGALDPTRSVRTGSPSAEITAYVDDAGVDFVAMASRGEGSFAGQLLGSTTDRVLKQVDVPVLVVRPDE